MEYSSALASLASTIPNLVTVAPCGQPVKVYIMFVLYPIL